MLKDILQSAQDYPAITAVVLIFIGAMIVIGLADLYVRIARRHIKNELQYEKLYARVEKEIDSAVSSDDKDAIRFDLKRLRSLKWKNKEKTDFIAMEFCKKLYGFDTFDSEHSPGQLDYERVHKEVQIANESRLAL
jgi:hypothetical protein